MCEVLAQTELFCFPVHVDMYTYCWFMKPKANFFENVAWFEHIPIFVPLWTKRGVDRKKTKEGCGMAEGWKTTNIAFLSFSLATHFFSPLSRLHHSPLSLNAWNRLIWFYKTNLQVLLSLNIPKVFYCLISAPLGGMHVLKNTWSQKLMRNLGANKVY